jgi:hypothetical protein
LKFAQICVIQIIGLIFDFLIVFELTSLSEKVFGALKLFFFHNVIALFFIRRTRFRRHFLRFLRKDIVIAVIRRVFQVGH